MRKADISKYPLTRHGWFLFYTDLWRQRLLECRHSNAAACEQRALWYFLLDLADLDPLEGER